MQQTSLCGCLLNAIQQALFWSFSGRKCLGLPKTLSVLEIPLLTLHWECQKQDEVFNRIPNYLVIGAEMGSLREVNRESSAVECVLVASYVTTHPCEESTFISTIAHFQILEGCDLISPVGLNKTNSFNLSPHVTFKLLGQSFMTLAQLLQLRNIFLWKRQKSYCQGLKCKQLLKSYMTSGVQSFHCIEKTLLDQLPTNLDMKNSQESGYEQLGVQGRLLYGRNGVPKLGRKSCPLTVRIFKVLTAFSLSYQDRSEI